MRALRIVVASLLAFHLSGLPAASQDVQPDLPGPPAQTPSPEKLLGSADEILKIDSKLRELSVLRPVDKGIATREEIEKFVKDSFSEEYTAEETRAAEIVLKRLGLAPRDFRYRDFMVRLLTEQVAGFYDVRRAKFFIAAWLPEELQRPTMAHELTHALQDQHFGGKRISARVPGNDDATLAHAAVIEGDAIAVMVDYMLQPMAMRFSDLPSFGDLPGLSNLLEGESNALLAQAPAYIRDSVLFPYMAGLDFIKAVKGGRGWAAVDRVYADLPVSTEQILHPEKYTTKRDAPSEITFASGEASLPAGWRETYRDVVGEFGWRELFKQALTPEAAAVAAAGWDGDQVVLVENVAGSAVMLILSAWDSDLDAAEFADGYGKSVTLARPEANRVIGRSEEVLRWNDGSDRVVLLRKGRSVFIADGPATVVTDGWVSALFKRASIRYR